MSKENKALIFLMLDQSWQEKHKGSRPAIPLFVRDLRVAYPGTEVLQQDGESCTLSVLCGEDQPQRVEDRVFALLQNALGSEDMNLAQWRIWPWDQAEDILKELESNGTLLPGASAEESQESGQPSAMKAIENLIGAQDFKVLAREITAVAPQIHRYGTLESFTRRCYLFTVGDGCGLSTCLNLLADLLGELKLFEFSGKRRVIELPPDGRLEEMANDVSSRSMVRQMVCFDLSQWMDKVQMPEFRTFLHSLRSVVGQQMFAFRIPFVDERTRLKVLHSLADVLTVQEVVLPPFSTAELRQYADRLLSAKSFSMDEESWTQFEERLIAEKSDGHFYGLDTVEKIVDELLYHKHLASVRAGSSDETRISAADLPPVSGSTQDQRPALEQLDELIGIAPIRERIMEIIAQIELAQKDAAMNPCLHMRFVGNPGTGKTTVARILGQLFKERQILSKGQFYEYTGRDFCGRYVGETAPKTAGMCRDAYGSVLFIDEAYSLYRGNADSNDYGREAIDTLIAQMENHRQDFMIIMAGYPDDMDKLMQANAGLASRMPYTIHFPNYSREELYQIFMSMVRRQFQYEPALDEAVKSYFDALPDEVIGGKEFANARFVRNLFERTWGKASVRRQINPEEPFVLCACDFDKAAADREFQQLQKKTKRIGF